MKISYIQKLNTIQKNIWNSTLVEEENICKSYILWTDITNIYFKYQNSNNKKAIKIKNQEEI